MAVVTTIDNSYQLEELFAQCGRREHFSYYGYQALYNYFEELSDEIGQDYQVDVIALCCDFTEYADWEEVYGEYAYSFNKEEKTWNELSEDEQEEFKEWVHDNTIILECTDYKDNLQGIILQCF